MGSQNAYPFDWWITPLGGLLRFLSEPDVDKLYNPELLAMKMRGSIRDSAYNTYYDIRLYHEFPRKEGGVVSNFLELTEGPKARTKHLLRNLSALEPDDGILFVQHAMPYDSQDPEEWVRGGEQIAGILKNSFGLRRFRLLMVNTPVVAGDKGTVLARTFDDVGGDWRGNIDLWTENLTSVATRATRQPPRGREVKARTPLPALEIATPSDPSPHAAQMAVVVMAVGAPPELTDAVQSLLEQDPEQEIAIVNSGGGKVSKRLPVGSERVSVYSCDEVLWPGAARNRGIERTSAPYVAFLAADCIASPNWVAARLARHQAGAAAVASAVANSAPKSLAAWASHITLFGMRLPGIPESMAGRYGASYARTLFVQHGRFREDLRIGEDTEFHERIGRKAPVWAPEVLTIHRSPKSLVGCVRDHYRRGQRSGHHWPVLDRTYLLYRCRRRLQRFVTTAKLALAGSERQRALASIPYAALCILAYELGAKHGQRRPDQVAILEQQARRAEAKRQWKAALAAWSKANKLRPGRMAPLVGRAEVLLKLKRFREAEAEFKKVRALWPDILVGHEGLARAAAGARRWRKSLSAWQKSLDILPDRKEPLAGCLTALLELGRLEEAEAACDSLLRRDPNDIAMGLCRGDIAERKGDWIRALLVYSELWIQCGNAEAIRRKVRLLIDLDRLEEAGTVVELLRADGIAARTFALAAVPYLEARHDWDGIVNLLQENKALTRTEMSLLEPLVNALALLGRTDEALPIIEKSQAGDAPTRGALKITALLRQSRHADDALLGKRRRADAVSAFQHFWQGPRLAPVTGALLGPMIMAAWETGGAELARQILDHAELDAGANGKTLPTRVLLLPFHRARIEGLVSLFSGREPQPPQPALEDQVLSRIEAARCGPVLTGKYGIALETCRRFAQLRASHPAFVPDPSFVFSDALEVARRLANAISVGHPFSLIRLGDGEGNFLPYRPEFQPIQFSDQSATQRTWWGHYAMEAKDRAGIETELRDSVRRSDIVGLPSVDRACRIVSNRQVNEARAAGKNARGVLAAIDFPVGLQRSTDQPGVDAQLLTSCTVHQALDFWGFWDILLPRCGSLSLVTCRRELGARLAERHAVAIEATHLIPPEMKYASPAERLRGGRHFPDTYLRLRDELIKSSAGRVTLVAAGILGKIYCRWIKEAGGIAIDIGSAADFWCGHETRTPLESSEYRGPDGLACQVQELAGHYLSA